MGEHIAVYGAAFNPPHAGHLNAIEQLLQRLDKVWVVPSFCHAFGKNMAPFEQRLAMIEAAIDASKLPPDRVLVLDVERQLAQQKPAGSPIYSWDLLNHLAQHHPHVNLLLAIGPDNARPAQWQKFYRHQDIDQRWQKCVVQEQLPVRSSDLRAQLARGERADEALLPASVQQLIRRFGLYGTGASGQ